MTPEQTRVDILSDLWMNYREDENLDDFIFYNDLGLPLAYAISTGIVEITPRAAIYLDETFNLLLESLEIEDTGFVNLDEMFKAAELKHS